MVSKKTVVENTASLAELTATPENKVNPPELEKVITLIELQKDLEGLTQGLGSLRKQVASQIGAIQYVQQKIEGLSRAE